MNNMFEFFFVSRAVALCVLSFFFLTLFILSLILF